MKKKILPLLLAAILVVPLACLSVFAESNTGKSRIEVYDGNGVLKSESNSWSGFISSTTGNKAMVKFNDDFGATEANQSKVYSSNSGKGDKYFYIDLNGNSLTLKEGIPFFKMMRSNPITVKYSDGSTKTFDGGSDVYLGDSGATVVDPSTNNNYFNYNINVYIYSSKAGASLNVSSSCGIADIVGYDSYSVYTGTSADDPGTCLYKADSNGANLYVGNLYAMDMGVSIENYTIEVSSNNEYPVFKTAYNTASVNLSNVVVRSTGYALDMEKGSAEIYSSAIVSANSPAINAQSGIRKLYSAYTSYIKEGDAADLFTSASHGTQNLAPVTFDNCNFVNFNMSSSSGNAIVGSGCTFSSEPAFSGVTVAANYYVAEQRKEITAKDGKTYVMNYALVSRAGDASVDVTTKPSAIFASGMVLQRDEPINVYGVGTDGDTVKVTFRSSTGSSESAEATVYGGRWQVSFAKRDAERGCSMTIEITDKNGTRTTEYSNIDIGEVWLVGGQSNVAYEVYKMEGAASYIANADNFDNIRIYTQSTHIAVYADYVGAGKWNNVTSEYLKKGPVSAVAYVMATRLATEFPDMAIALVNVDWSGCNIQAWINEETYVENFGAVTNDYKQFVDYRNFYDANGRLPKSKDDVATYDSSIFHLAVASYNALFAHLEGYSARGAVWYQGCANIGDGKTGKYAQYFDALRECWGEAMGNPELPFFIVQLAPYISSGGAPDFRSAQYSIAATRDNTYLVNAHIDGNVFNASDLANSSATATSSSPMIHPSRKATVGIRLADSVLTNIYGMNTDKVVEAPEVQKIEYTGGKVVITFDTELKIFYGDELEGFEVAGDDGVFVTAKATISGNTVILESSVKSPKTVRYGYGADIVVELEDGTLIKCAPDKSLHGSDAATGVVKLVDINGVEHTFNSSDNIVVRSFMPGNLTNASGYPMSVFMLAVGYGE